ncbi:hypothetical protein [Mucilaginibacter sp.]
MFEKLFLLVKSNAGNAILQNPVIPAKHREAAVNEASSSIIEVLKAQMESGKINELIKFFQLTGVKNTSLVTSIINRFANKLNKYYDIDPASAHTAAEGLIPPVMQQLVQQSRTDQNPEQALSSMLSALNGNHGDLSSLVHQLIVAA